MKNRAVPMRDCRVETESSFGTGMKLKMSTLRKQRRKMFGCYSFMNDSEVDYLCCILIYYYC